MKKLIRDFITFGIQQALACIFPAMVFTLLGLSHLMPAWLPRYDFILTGCLLVQYLMYRTGIETADEVRVICLFHLLGLMMELFKVHIGSWSYPEFAYTKVGGVPLYSGFMYASVASYLCQAWRRLDVEITNWPARTMARICGALIYLNFFSNHFIPDLRWAIGVLILYFFRRTIVHYRINDTVYRMPLILSFLLIGLFIWFAENIATLLGAWQYAYQHKRWAMVDGQKISSWFFLVIVSFIIVAELKMLKEGSGELTTEGAKT